MKKIALILGLLLICFAGFSQDGVVRKTQIEKTDTLSTHIETLNWGEFISNVVDTVSISIEAENVSVEDTAGNYTATNVEGVLKEIYDERLIQQLINGSKTASFSHDASLYSKGAYPYSNTSALTVSLHNLESGMVGTITLDIGANNPSDIDVAGYSDAGVTSITVVEMNQPSNAANKRTIILYDCQDFGSYTDVTITYQQEE